MTAPAGWYHRLKGKECKFALKESVVLSLEA
jgi:hypothetical protein